MANWIKLKFKDTSLECWLFEEGKALIIIILVNLINFVLHFQQKRHKKLTEINEICLSLLSFTLFVHSKKA